jgi:hypothetical protein
VQGPEASKFSAVVCPECIDSTFWIVESYNEESRKTLVSAYFNGTKIALDFHSLYSAVDFFIEFVSDNDDVKVSKTWINRLQERLSRLGETKSWDILKRWVSSKTSMIHS